MIQYEGIPVSPSFRVERGEVKREFGFFADGMEAAVIMHPYDIVQALAENGEISKAFAALNGFLGRRADIMFYLAMENLYSATKPDTVKA